MTRSESGASLYRPHSCWFNVGPASQTVVQHWISAVWMWRGKPYPAAPIGADLTGLPEHMVPAVIARYIQAYTSQFCQPMPYVWPPRRYANDSLSSFHALSVLQERGFLSFIDMVPGDIIILLYYSWHTCRCNKSIIEKFWRQTIMPSLVGTIYSLIVLQLSCIYYELLPINLLTRRCRIYSGLPFLLAHYVPHFKHVKDKMLTSISNIWKQLTSILSNLNNFHSLEDVDRVSETQLQVSENSDGIIWRLKG